MISLQRRLSFLAIACCAGLGCLAPQLYAAVYTVGSIDGQNGWSGGSVAISSAVDQAVTNAAAFTGTQSWRVSNSTVNGNVIGAFSSWPFSPGLSPAAGQPSSLALADRFETTFWFKAATNSSAGDGSSMEFDFGNPSGTDRTNFFAIRNVADGNGGLLLRVAESVNTGAQFLPTQTIATLLDRNVWHRIDLTGTFINGDDNDTFTVSLDGSPIINANNTSPSPNFNTPNYNTFEGFRNFNSFPYELTNRLFFRSGAAGSAFGYSDTAPLGFFVDDLTYRTYNSAIPNVTLGFFDSNSFEATVAVIPEPSTFALLGLGAIGLAIRTRRRRTTA